MESKRVTILLALVLFIFLTLVMVINPQYGLTGFVTYVENSIEDITQDKVDEGVIQGLEENQDIRVRVEFKQEEDQSLLNALDKEDKQELLDQVEDKIKHETEEYITLQINEQDLELIQETDQVEKVVAITQRGMMLSDSTNIIQAQEVWNISAFNQELIGTGETICILDSGVDYTHPDLGACFGPGCKVIAGYDYCADDTNCLTEDSDPLDVHGHGTHVSGIAAANGTTKGVAPGANIVLIKVCSQAGACWDDDIKAGIDWCVDNSEEYNISVISMSLGGGLFEESCDNDISDTEDITSSVNNAVSQGISVVASAGNEGSSTTIAFPACLSNVIPVGATSKSDLIFYNRNPLVKLLAPGISITSTIIGGGTQTFSGTSMSAPHVSGAIAILNQYKRLEQNTLTPSEYENALYNSGFEIQESGNTYSRINLYQALLAIDNTLPTGNLISPTNNENNFTNLLFNCNASDNIQLLNLTLMIWNSSDLYYSLKNNSLEIITNLTLPIENYTWNCLAQDSNNLLFVSNTNYTISQEAEELETPENETIAEVQENETIAEVQENETIVVEPEPTPAPVAAPASSSGGGGGGGGGSSSTSTSSTSTTQNTTTTTTTKKDSTTKTSDNQEDIQDLIIQERADNVNQRTLHAGNLQGFAILDKAEEFVIKNSKITIIIVAIIFVLVIILLRRHPKKK